MLILCLVCYTLFRKPEYSCQTKGKVAYTSGISSYTSMQQSHCFTEKCFTLQKMHDGTGIMKSSSCSA